MVIEEIYGEVAQLESEPEVNQIGESPEEPPFDIPNKWKWIQVKALEAKRKTVCPISLNNDKVELWSIPAYDEGRAQIVSPSAIGSSKKIVSIGDVLLAKIVPHIKRSWVVTENRPEAPLIKLASTEWLIYQSDLFIPDFLVLLFKSPYFRNKMMKTISGMGSLKRTNPKALSQVWLPLPPKEEQYRILSRVERLWIEIDQMESAYKELLEISNQLRKKILRKAIEGKLVPQLESEPKVELRNEKESFNIPFEIPTKWKWTTLEQICLQITDGEHKTPKYQKDGVPFLSVKDISSKKLNFSDTKFVSLEDFDVIKKRCHPQKGDILLSKVGSTGIPAIVDTDKDFALFVSVALLKLNKLLVLDKFLWYLLQSPLVQKQAKENTRGIGNKNWVLKAIKATIVPLPPIPEQRRIVDQLEKIFSSINSLSK